MLTCGTAATGADPITQPTRAGEDLPAATASDLRLGRAEARPVSELLAAP